MPVTREFVRMLDKFQLAQGIARSGRTESGTIAGVGSATIRNGETASGASTLPALPGGVSFTGTTGSITLRTRPDATLERAETFIRSDYAPSVIEEQAYVLRSGQSSPAERVFAVLFRPALYAPSAVADTNGALLAVDAALYLSLSETINGADLVATLRLLYAYRPVSVNQADWLAGFGATYSAANHTPALVINGAATALITTIVSPTVSRASVLAGADYGGILPIAITTQDTRLLSAITSAAGASAYTASLEPVFSIIGQAATAATVPPAGLSASGGEPIQIVLAFSIAGTAEILVA